MGDVRAEATKLEGEMKSVVDAKGSDQFHTAMDVLQKDVAELRKDPKFATDVLKQITTDAQNSNDLPKISVHSDESGVAQYFFFGANPKDENGDHHMAISEALTDAGKKALKEGPPDGFMEFMKSLNPPAESMLKA